MRLASAAEMKGVHKIREAVPREGTKIRAVFDLLNANKGRVVEISINGMCGYHGRSIIDRLTDSYGLDVRCLKAGSKPQWLLAGEWFGRVYVDYVAERLEAKQ